MGSMPFALSLHSLVSSLGADAGFAAVVGLAILVLLYFAHARETEDLREEADVLSERLQQAEAKLAQLRRGQPPVAAEATPSAPAQPEVVPPPGQPAPATPGGQAGAMPAAPPVAAEATPAAPAGVGAPALAAATRYVPAAARTGSEPVPAQPPDASPAPAPVPRRPQPAVAAMRQAAPGASPSQQSSGAVSAPAPATAAGAANGGREDRSMVAPPRPVERPSVARRPAGRTPPPRGGSRGRFVPPQPPPRRPSNTGRIVGALVAALVVVGAIAGLLIATSGGGSSQPSAAKAPASNAPAPAPKPAPAAFNPGSVTVAVLNGTSTNNLAHKVGARLVSGGYKQGTVATASDQTRTKTVVAYLPGNRNDALHVATALKLGPSAVSPVDSSTQAIACPPPASCNAQVIVTVGSDLANL